MTVCLYVAEDVFNLSQFSGGRAQLAEGCAGIKRDSTQRGSQLMGKSTRDSFHGQKPVGAFASLQDESVGKA